MRRGELYVAAERGVLTTKPRPVLVVQNDPANAIHQTITICLVSTAHSSFSRWRVLIEPSRENGLERPSEIQVDRLFSLQRDSLSSLIGLLSPTDMAQVDLALRRWLAL